MASPRQGYPDPSSSQAVDELGCPTDLERIVDSINDFYQNIQAELQKLEDNYIDSVHLIDQQRTYAVQAQARALEIVKNSLDNFCEQITEQTNFTADEEHHRTIDEVTSSLEELSIFSTTQKFVGQEPTPDV